jgi:hypothetical protein
MSSRWKIRFRAGAPTDARRKGSVMYPISQAMCHPTKYGLEAHRATGRSESGMASSTSMMGMSSRTG